MGGEPVLFPVIAVGPPPSWAAFDEAIARLHTYAWLVFTSPSAVRYAMERAPDLPPRLHALGAPAVAAVGAETAKALAGHSVVAVVPDDQRQEGLVGVFRALPPGTRILFPQAVGGREFLRESLERAGVSVDVVPVSQTIASKPGSGLPNFDVATFASPSALRAFIEQFGTAPLSSAVVAVIGPTTEAAARRAGVTVDVVASAPSVAALVSALCAYRRPR